MSRKFIPNGDQDFAVMAEAFARTIAGDPGRFAVSGEDAAALTAATEAYRAALQAARFGARSAAATAAKEAARVALEAVVRRTANAVRNDPKVGKIAKGELGLRERTRQPTVLTVPNESPRLEFVRAIHDAHMIPQHELKFCSLDHKPRPAGAVRLELFVDLIAPDEPVPAMPGTSAASRPFYLRSYTRSPIRLTPPLASEPMRVVYWARWADSAGNVGPFSATATGWIEGGSHHLMPTVMRRDERPEIVDASRPPADEQRRATVIVALMQTQRGQRAIAHEPRDATALPSPDEGTARSRAEAA